MFEKVNYSKWWLESVVNRWQLSTAAFYELGGNFNGTERWAVENGDEVNILKTTDFQFSDCMLLRQQ